MAASVWTALAPLSVFAHQALLASGARAISMSAFPNHVLVQAQQTVCNCSTTTSATADQAGVDVSVRSGSTSVPPIPVPMAGPVLSLNPDTSAPAPKASLDLIAASTVGGSAPQHHAAMVALAWQIHTARLDIGANVPRALMDQNARLTPSMSVVFTTLVEAVDVVRTRRVAMRVSAKRNTEDGIVRYST